MSSKSVSRRELSKSEVSSIIRAELALHTRKVEQYTELLGAMGLQIEQLRKLKERIPRVADECDRRIKELEVELEPGAKIIFQIEERITVLNATIVCMGL